MQNVPNMQHELMNVLNNIYFFSAEQQGMLSMPVQIHEIQHQIICSCMDKGSSLTL